MTLRDLEIVTDKQNPLNTYDAITVRDTGTGSLTIDNCHVQSAFGSGIHVSAGATPPVIVDNYIHHCGVHGIHVRSSTGARIEGNIIRECGNAGILVANPTGRSSIIGGPPPGSGSSPGTVQPQCIHAKFGGIDK